MNRKLSTILAVVFTLLSLFGLVACANDGDGEQTGVCSQHTYEMVTVEPTCTENGSTKRICTACGHISNQWTSSATGHKYKTDEQQSTTGDCNTDGELVKVCKACGDVKVQIVPGDGHKATQNTDYKHLKTQRDASGKAEYYESCSRCEENLTQTFFVEVASADSVEPTSPTVTLFDTENLSYGFTWNCSELPTSPAVALKKTNESSWSYTSARAVQYTTLSSSGATVTYYVCKADVELDKNTQYTYKLVEGASGAESDNFDIFAVDTKANSFTFASFSDSQNSAESGAMWGEVLQKTQDVDFYIHTGDICEDTAHEDNWKNMLHSNRQYLATKPMMVSAGNHDTNYKSGREEIFKHFHNNIPTQPDTYNGYYYSFVYSNAKFFVVNTNRLTANNDLTENQLAWLEYELKNNDSKWTIVVMHNPMYSVGKWGSNASINTISLALQEQLGDMFAEYGVDLVLQGHDHTVSKTFPIAKDGVVAKCNQQNIGGVLYDLNPQGTIYVMNGPTGDQEREPMSSYATNLYEKAQKGVRQSWAEYTVTQDKITIQVKYLSGSQEKVYYTWGIQKS